MTGIVIIITHTHTHNNNNNFTALLDFFQDYLGELAPDR